MAVIKTIDLVGVSEVSWEDGAKQAVAEARKTIRNLDARGCARMDGRHR